MWRTCSGMAATSVQVTTEQLRARERWQSRWNLPLILAALLPLFISSPDTRWVEVVVGLGSWIVFVVDLVVQRRIVPDYLHQRRGRFDVAVVVITFPFYLIPGVSGGSAILLLARLGRVARVLLATAGLRRFAARLGKVAMVAGAVVLVCSLAAYQAEHKTNEGYATVGDALWWGIVTLTTVGYGDIVPHTPAGRFAGIAIMFTGIGVLGVLAGSLADLFHLDESPPPGTAPINGAPPPVHAELAALRGELQAVEASPRRTGRAHTRGRRVAPTREATVPPLICRHDAALTTVSTNSRAAQPRRPIQAPTASRVRHEVITSDTQTHSVASRLAHLLRQRSKLVFCGNSLFSTTLELVPSAHSDLPDDDSCVAGGIRDRVGLAGRLARVGLRRRDLVGWDRQISAPRDLVEDVLELRAVAEAAQFGAHR